MYETILVIAANALAVANSCAGTIARYSKEGARVYVILLKDVEQRKFFTSTLTELLHGVYIEEWHCKNESFLLSHDIHEKLACTIRTLRPDCIITHAKKDSDYNDVTQLTLTSYAIATAAGVYCNGLPVAARQTPMFCMEPMGLDSCSFTPDIFIDITTTKEEKQAIMKKIYIDDAQILKSKERDALHAKIARQNGRSRCEYAEAYSMVTPICVHNAFIW